MNVYFSCYGNTNKILRQSPSHTIANPKYYNWRVCLKLFLQTSNQSRYICVQCSDSLGIIGRL